MKQATSEPPGRTPRRQSVITLPRKSALNRPLPVMPDVGSLERTYRSVEHMVRELRPEMPVQCLRPATIAATARRFLKLFPGDVMYAVKTNPDARVLGYLSRAGIAHFDVASLAEIKMVADAVPDAKMYFMHPVKSRESIRAAYFQYGIRDFSLDSHDELKKIMEVTGDADDLTLYVRLSIPNESAAYRLTGKFGVLPEQASSLVLATRTAANRLGICFHVGSQCMDAEAYVSAMRMVSDLVQQTGVKLDVLDIGGGFPSIYPGMVPPPLAHYMKVIRRGLKSFPLLAGCHVVCEPGRALVAEGGSIVARVELRKGNALYLNDGTYGSLFDAGFPGFVFPVRAMRPMGTLSQEVAEFTLFGPTCDSLDAMKGPFHLPSNIAEGDWIEVGQLGSYGATMATRFNGFQSDLTVEVGDKPLLSMLGVN